MRTNDDSCWIMVSPIEVEPFAVWKTRKKAQKILIETSKKEKNNIEHLQNIFDTWFMGFIMASHSDDDCSIPL